MGWNEPEYDSSDSCDDGGDVELCHPLCQCRKCAPTQRVYASLVCGGVIVTRIIDTLEHFNIHLHLYSH